MTAFFVALLIHLVWLILLAWVRPPPRFAPVDYDIPAAPYEVFLAPRGGGDPAGRADAGEAGGRGAGLRTLEPRAGAPAPEATVLEASEAAPEQGSGLRGAQALEPAPAQEPPLPSLAPTPPPIAVAPPPSLTRPTTPEGLRALQAPDLAPPEPPLPTLAEPRPRLNLEPPPSVQRSPAPSGLRPIQGPTLPAPEPPLPTLAAPGPALQIAPAPAVTAQASPALRAAPRLDLPAPAPTLPTLAARPQPLQVQAPPALRGAAAAPSLRAQQGLSIPGAGAPAGELASGAPGAGGPGAPGGAQAARGSGVHPGCEVEILMLLTPEERTRCRNQIDAFNERLAAQREAEARARRVAQALSGPRVDRIEAGQRTYFDAVVAAREQVRSGVGAAPGLACNLGALFGGGGGAPGDKIKVPGLPCVITPPVGVLTEESRLTPP